MSVEKDAVILGILANVAHYRLKTKEECLDMALQYAKYVNVTRGDIEKVLISSVLTTITKQNGD